MNWTPVLVDISYLIFNIIYDSNKYLSASRNTFWLGQIKFISVWWKRIIPEVNSWKYIFLIKMKNSILIFQNVIIISDKVNQAIFFFTTNNQWAWLGL